MRLMAGHRGSIHHVDLTVSDVTAARSLYDLVLTHMGYVCTGETGAIGGVEWYHASEKFLSIGIKPAQGPNAARPHDRYAPGLHHLAWASETREDVDALHAKLLAFGANILDPPADYPQYNKGRGYYAVFFADPDGLKLEYVWTP